jgi:hypothetical protein
MHGQGLDPHFAIRFHCAPSLLQAPGSVEANNKWKERHRQSTEQNDLTTLPGQRK